MTTKKAKWTFMVYLAGDNNLSDFGVEDVNEMRQVGSSDDVNVLVELDRAGSVSTSRFHIRKLGEDETSVTLGETDSGDPNTLRNFVDWAAANYPAERYALILWNHGSGWEPSELDRMARDVGSPDFNPAELTDRAAESINRILFRTSIEEILGLDSPVDRAICFDDGSGHSLDTIELGKVIRDAATTLGQPLDLLGMDACLMSNFEVVYQLRGAVRYLVASEELEPADGWPYDRVLSALVANPDMLSGELASHIVEAYIQSYLDIGELRPVTQTAFDLSQVQRLAEPLNTLAELLADDMGRYINVIWQALRRTAAFHKETLVDVGQLCDEIEARTDDAELSRACQSLRAALAQGEGNPVLAERHNGKKVDGCYGVSLYWPPMREPSRYYSELAFAQDYAWPRMLAAYNAV